MFSLEKRKFCGDWILACHCLEGDSNEDGDKYFSRAYCPRTRGNGFKLKEHRFRLNMRKKIFMMGLVKHKNRLLREVVDVQSLETFKVRLDGALLKMSLQAS